MDFLTAGRLHDERFERLFAPWNEREMDHILEMVICSRCGTYTYGSSIEVRDGVKWCLGCIECEKNKRERTFHAFHKGHVGTSRSRIVMYTRWRFRKRHWIKPGINNEDQD